jgi:hypothetical protein
MNKVEVITGTETAFDLGETPIVVLADQDVETISVGEVGPPGPPGPAGPPGPGGVPGNTIMYGTRDPVPADGNNGDFWINTTTMFIFGPKANHAWLAGADMVGATIWNGAADPTAGIGVDGDFYINTTTHFFFGPKAAGAWPAGFSVVGPQGIQGIQGPQGPKGDTGGVGPPGASGVAVAYIQDNPPVGAPDNSLWLESDTGILYAHWNDGTSTQWVQITNMPDATTMGAVSYKVAQAQTPAQQQIARTNIDAATFDALGYFGAQLNGACQVDQLGLGVLGVGTGFGYYTDLWQAASSVGNFNCGNGPNPIMGYYANGFMPMAFNRAMRLLSTVAQPAVVAADYTMMGMPIEGNRFSKFGFGFAGALPVTIGFWIYADAGGTASVVLRNGANSRSCPKNFTVATATAKWVTLTFPPCTDGAWPTDNTMAARLDFVFRAGTTYQGADGVWGTNGSGLGTPQNSNNFFAAASSGIYITGLVILPGTQAPTAAQSVNVIRPRQHELIDCQRYHLIVPITVMFAPGHLRGGGTTSYNSMMFPVPMRVKPVIGYPGNTSVWCADANSTLTALGINGFSADGTFLMLSPSLAASIGAGGQACFFYEPTAPMQFDARM